MDKIALTPSDTHFGGRRELESLLTILPWADLGQKLIPPCYQPQTSAWERGHGNCMGGIPSVQIPESHIAISTTDIRGQAYWLWVLKKSGLYSLVSWHLSSTVWPCSNLRSQPHCWAMLNLQSFLQNNVGNTYRIPGVGLCSSCLRYPVGLLRDSVSSFPKARLTLMFQVAHLSGPKACMHYETF